MDKERTGRKKNKKDKTRKKQIVAENLNEVVNQTEYETNLIKKKRNEKKRIQNESKTHVKKKKKNPKRTRQTHTHKKETQKTGIKATLDR